MPTRQVYCHTKGPSKESLASTIAIDQFRLLQVAPVDVVSLCKVDSKLVSAGRIDNLCVYPEVETV
jgi:hypothetical protein